MILHLSSSRSRLMVNVYGGDHGIVQVILAISTKIQFCASRSTSYSRITTSSTVAHHPSTVTASMQESGVRNPKTHISVICETGISTVWRIDYKKSCISTWPCNNGWLSDRMGYGSGCMGCGRSNRQE